MELVLGLVYMAGKMGYLNREGSMGVYMAANLGMFLWLSREDNNSLGPKMDEIGARKEVLPMKVNIVGVQEDKKENKTGKVARHWEQKQVGEAARWSTTCWRSRMTRRWTRTFLPSLDVAHALLSALLSRVLAAEAACVASGCHAVS